MSSPLHNIVLGAVAATAIALMLIVPNIGGISTWKYLLAAIGLVFWFLSAKPR
jgi:hypothetical protein